MRLVEKQMRNWELARAQLTKPQPDVPPPSVADFVAISRSVASGGSQVATLLGERLRWPVFDREILQAMAGDDRVRARLYEHLDERDQSWLEQALRWVIGGELPKDDYLYRLTETVLALARQGHAVFLGRGADLILPPEHGLRVRITASAARRAAELARRRGITVPLAMAELERIDRERAEFRRRHFGKSANDPACYDLTISLDRFTVQEAVELIVTVLKRRGVVSEV